MGLIEYCLSILQLKSDDVRINIDTPEHIKGGEGLTPLHLAIKNRHLQTACLLVRQKASPSIPDSTGRLPILLAVEKGWDLLVKDLLKASKALGKEDLKDAKDSEGNTPLCVAAAKGYEKITPLDLAEENGHEEVVKILEEKEGQLKA
ncbi:MAG: hypothetical protein MMC33_000597 [Icmadophila ericetorum]|nr:hypothetical protein [Icmadophila ericetorum]